MRLRSLAVALLAPLMSVGALAGCGGGTTVRVAGHSVALTLEEYRIVPQTVSVPAGRLQIVARNRGILTHNLEVERGSLDSTERTVLATIHTLLPGASESVVTQPLAPGRYLLVSTVGNQAVLGMSGTLIVR
ncbi:MAG: hypothetical protein ACHQE6_08340 [Solirubrobacterales bacterium]